MSPFKSPPWRYHHTERVHGNFLPYMPGSQDFFSLAPGTPLWAIRPVHYGKEIIRFTIYCRNENFAALMKMYELILKRRICQKKADFCAIPIYSNADIDIQFSLKKLPRGHVPSPTDSAVLEFRVKDIGQLVPLLPNPCNPISEGRWQTEDPDGNKILLQQAWYKKCVKQNSFCWSSTPSRKLPVAPLPNFVPQGNQPSPVRTSGLSKPINLVTFHPADQCLGISQQDLRNSDQESCPRRSKSAFINSGSFQRSKSLVSLPTSRSSMASEALHLSEPDSLSTLSYRARTRVHIDDLEGVQETDVDTGMKLAFSDLSVVSAYSVSDGNNMEGRRKYPTQGQSVSRHSFSRGRSHSAKRNPFELSTSFLPFDQFSSISVSPSASPSTAHTEIKYSSRGTVFSFGDSRTTGGGKTNEEEFYI
ncbi:hypothetical protein lerEdw1_019284 [Lerista edwardsae]|nr:hypothetical protein lerEdw1_019284 [Lerista edwardsae]